MFRYFWSALSFIILLFIVLQLSGLFKSIPKSTTHGSPLAAKLFQQLQKQDLLTINKDWRIELPSKDHVLALKSDTTQSDTQQTLIDALYDKQYGKRLRKQVALWNYSRRLAAIRDNRKQENDHNNWQISDENKIPIQSFSLVPLSFGYLTQGKLQKGFHNWLGAGWQQRKLIFSSDFNLDKKTTITLHIVGTPDLSELGAYKPRLKTCTPDACQTGKAPSDSTAIVSILSLSLPAKSFNLKIPVNTSLNPAKHINGLALMVTDKIRAKQIQAVAQKDCKAVPETKAEMLETTSQVLVWNNCSLALGGGNGNSDTPQNQPFQIITRDKVALTKPYDKDHLTDMGKPSKDTIDNGLTALIGQDKKDIYSLSGLMWKAGLAKDAKLQLTLDSRLQKIAYQHLEEAVTKKAHPNRRAAVVILKPQTGEILAAANYPNPEMGVHLWDRKAISELYPNKDPYRFNPWQGLTGDNAPGSTFKTVTTLAAIQDVKNNPKLATMIKGIPPKQYLRKLGLNPKSTTYKVKGMNRGVTSHSIDEANISLFNGSCGESKKRRGKVGVAEATSKSLNNWFMHLGVLMDGQRLKDREQQLQLIKTANWLGFNQVYSLGAELQRYKGNDWKRGDVLNAFGGRMAIADKGRRNLFELANNSYGQGMSTTPLQMARVAATLATGENKQPILIKSLAGKKLDAPNIQKLDIDPELLNELKLGMRGVVQKGTAKNKFKDKRQCQVYGKTGTAEVKGGKNTMWFMGWYEPEPNKPELAFACMATHYPDGVYGGTLCAPIIDKILRDWKELASSNKAK